MADTISTLDVPVRWADEVGEIRQWAGTRFFLFTTNVGHLLVREPVRGEGGGAEPESSATSTAPLTAGRTMPGRLEGLHIPRAQRVSTRLDERYILLKKYEGFITSRGERSFVARLFENAGDYPVLEAEFGLDELSETDRELAVEGAAMVWTIGYHYEGSTRKRESTIYLRRLTPWSEKEIAQAKQKTEELICGIRWE